MIVKHFNLKNMLKNLLFIIMFATSILTVSAQRWQIDAGGGIVWHPSGDLPHNDHIEMSGEQTSVILRWGVDKKGAFHAERSLVFPMLRVLPNDTHASLMSRFATDFASMLAINTNPVGFNASALQFEKVKTVAIDGALTVKSMWSFNSVGAGSSYSEDPDPVIEMVRTIFPSRTLPVVCERYIIRNISSKPFEVTIPEFSQVITTDPVKSPVEQAYVLRADLLGTGNHRLQPNDSIVFDAVLQAYRDGEGPQWPDVAKEYASRMEFARQDVGGSLILETPDPIINTEFRYAKFRASESIFRTRRGYMHAPGGECYYAAIWANDQAEYVNPFFPFLGYDIGNESALNSFRHFACFMSPDYKAIPSSIIAEGDDIWNGAGDRGDASMIAYGAARYALSRGVRAEAEELWPLIEWCLEYCRRQLLPEGVVASDTDELEGRFPAGKANLCTSTLYYDALRSTIYLAQELGKSTKKIQEYKQQSEVLAKAIENYFGANVGGYETYRYYDGNTKLRSWICMPLIAGLKGRTEGTVQALLGPELMTEEGLLTEQGSTTFWDRSTLYSLRGIYIAGQTDRATEFLHHYSERRLLGDHVPYPIEAWPEGEQRHLSAESGLYCRVITEGLFGLRPTGLRSFDLTPSLPTKWDQASLKHIKAFDSDFDIIVQRISDGRLQVNITQKGRKTQQFRIHAGNTIKVVLH